MTKSTSETIKEEVEMECSQNPNICPILFNLVEIRDVISSYFNIGNFSLGTFVNICKDQLIVKLE